MQKIEKEFVSIAYEMNGALRGMIAFSNLPIETKTVLKEITARFEILKKRHEEEVKSFDADFGN